MTDSKREKPDRTIEGGPPHGKRRRLFRGKVKVPVGVEKALFHAACDEDFKRRLLADPRAAIEQAGIRLRPSEIAMLAAVPSAMLEDMIDRVVPENPNKRKFMGLVANAAASLAAGTVLVSCGEDKISGSLGSGPETGTTATDDGGTQTATDDGGTQTGTGSATDSDTVETSNPDNGSDGGVGPDTETDTDSGTSTDTGTGTTGTATGTTGTGTGTPSGTGTGTGTTSSS